MVQRYLLMFLENRSLCPPVGDNDGQDDYGVDECTKTTKGEATPSLTPTASLRRRQQLWVQLKNRTREDAGLLDSTLLSASPFGAKPPASCVVTMEMEIQSVHIRAAHMTM